MWGRREHHRSAVLDVGGEDLPSRKRDRVVGVVEVARTRAGYPRDAIAVGNPVSGDVDDADREVVFLGGNDRPATRAEEGVVWNLEGLTRGEVAGPRKAPHDMAVRIDLEEPVIRFVGDQHVAGKDARVGARAGEGIGI